MPEVLAPLIPLALALACLAIAYMLTALVIALMKPIVDLLSQIPVIGGKLAGLVVKVEQTVSNAIGNAFGAVEKLVGVTFHEMARMTDWLWRELEAHSSLIAALANPLATLMLAVHALKSLVHSTAHGIASALPRVKELEKQYHGIEHELHTLEHEISKGIGNDVLPRIKSLEREVGTLAGTTIPAIRGIADDARTEVSALQKWITANIPLIGTSVFAGAVAVALGALGLGGLRCNTLLNSLKNRGCGLWSGLEDLLGLFVDTLLLTNVCELVPVLETAVSDVADPLVIALTDVGAGLCSGGIGAAPPLQAPALSLPANPGFSLSIA